MYVCMCVCMYVCMCVCVCVYVCMYVCVYVCMCVDKTHRQTFLKIHCLKLCFLQDTLTGKNDHFIYSLLITGYVN